jgi:hypothetical protein
MLVLMNAVRRKGGGEGFFTSRHKRKTVSERELRANPPTWADARLTTTATTTTTTFNYCS